MIGNMRNKITFSVWTHTKDNGGGLTPSVSSTFEVWANIEARSGFIQTANDQRQWPYDYRITVRYDDRINEKLTITHSGKVLQINSMQIQDEGKNKLLVLRCSTR